MLKSNEIFPNAVSLYAKFSKKNPLTTIFKVFNTLTKNVDWFFFEVENSWLLSNETYFSAIILYSSIAILLYISIAILKILFLFSE